MLNLFISNEEAIQESKDLVISKGMLYVNIMCFLYLCPCVTNSIQSYFRGIGKLNIVFYSTFVQIIGRVLFSLILISTTNDPLSSTAYGTGIGWAFMISFELPFLITYWKTEKNLSN
jgi:Na+-driven multidrug efflux pump